MADQFDLCEVLIRYPSRLYRLTQTDRLGQAEYNGIESFQPQGKHKTMRVRLIAGYMELSRPPANQEAELSNEQKSHFQLK